MNKNTRNMIPKRIHKKIPYLTSADYKNVLKLKFFKWNHTKAARIYYTMFTRAYNPYARDWFYIERTKTNQEKAEVMFDTMFTMLKRRMEKVPERTKKEARRQALFMWAERQQTVDGRIYLVYQDTIKAVKK